MEFVEIRGEKYPYKLSYRALKNISSLSKDGNLGIESVEHALYWGLYSGWSIEKNAVDFPFKIEHMENILDEQFELFSKVQEDIQALTNKINGEEGKQKPLETGATSGTVLNKLHLEN